MMERLFLNFSYARIFRLPFLVLVYRLPGAGASHELLR